MYVRGYLQGSENGRVVTIELLSSLRRQRQRQCLGRLSFRLIFLSESISQKLSKVSI
jgi:hypothetical protein